MEASHTNSINKLTLAKRWLIGAFVILSTIGLVKLNLKPAMAPDLTFTTTAGQQIKLKSLIGQPALVTFWATDCPACVAEIPHLASLYQQQHCHGLEIIAISMAYDPPNHVMDMTKTKQIPYPVVLDITGEYALAFGNVTVTPTTFLLDSNGKIADHFTGALNPEQLASITKEQSCSG